MSTSLVTRFAHPRRIMRALNAPNSQGCRPGTRTCPTPVIPVTSSTKLPWSWRQTKLWLAKALSLQPLVPRWLRRWLQPRLVRQTLWGKQRKVLRMVTILLPINIRLLALPLVHRPQAHPDLSLPLDNRHPVSLKSLIIPCNLTGNHLKAQTSHGDVILTSVDLPALAPRQALSLTLPVLLVLMLDCRSWPMDNLPDQLTGLLWAGLSHRLPMTRVPLRSNSRERLLMPKPKLRPRVLTRAGGLLALLPSLLLQILFLNHSPSFLLRLFPTGLWDHLPSHPWHNNLSA